MKTRGENSKYQWNLRAGFKYIIKFGLFQPNQWVIFEAYKEERKLIKLELKREITTDNI